MKNRLSLSPVLYALIVLCLNPGNMLAAELTVIVKQKGSGSPVEAAIVILDDSEIYAETDHTGIAKFANIDIPLTLKILATGYDILDEDINPDENTITLYLEPMEMSGSAIEVTAERIEEKASRISLARDELTRTAGSMGDPLKAIAALPGIIPAGESNTQVYMRGSNTNENIIWVNRAPVGYLYHLGGFQSTIHPALIEDINVFLGGFPVEYGNALGGVIDARLRPPQNDRKHYYFDISTIASSFLVEGPVAEAGGDSYFIAGRRSYIDLIFSPDEFNKQFQDDDKDDPDQFTLVPRFYDFQSLYRHQLDQGYLDAYIFAAGDEAALDVRGSAVSDPQLSGALNQKQSYFTTGITWQQILNSEWEQFMTLAYYRNKNSLRLGRDINGNPYFANVETNALFWQPELLHRLAQDDQLTFGFASVYTRAPVDLNISRPPDEDDIYFDFTGQPKFILNKTLYVNELSPYIKYRTQLTDKLVTIVGVNYSNLSITGGYSQHELSPRASLEYSATENTLLTASWGRFIQPPDGVEIIETFGNPGLEVTAAEHRILGIQYKFNPLYSIKTEIYHKPMKNLVVSIDTNTPPENYLNEGTGEAYGIDIFLKREPRDRKMGWFALSYARSERTNEITHITRDFTGDQPLTFTALWGQPFGGDWKRWDWSVKAEIHSGTPYTEVTGRHQEDPLDPSSRWIPEFGTHNAARTPTYFKMDLRIAREVLMNTGKLKLYVDIQNVTFNNNIVEYDYGNEYEKIGRPTEISGIGFFPFFGAEIEF